MAIEAEEIEKLIKAALPDASIDIKDTVGDKNHYSAHIISDKFKNLTLLQQHKLIYDALGEKLKEQLHAISLHTSHK
jgi:stress-induced morphogen